MLKKIKFQNILRVSSYFWRSYRGKSGRWSPPHISSRVKEQKLFLKKVTWSSQWCYEFEFQLHIIRIVLKKEIPTCVDTSNFKIRIVNKIWIYVINIIVTYFYFWARPENLKNCMVFWWASASFADVVQNRCS